MPAYQNNPFAVVPLYMVGVPAYLFGSRNPRQANTRILVSNVVSTGGTGTVTGTIVEGEVPVVGAPISITQTASASGAFNVNRAVVTAVSFNNVGFGTVSFALAGTVASVADFGTAIVEVPELSETIVAGASTALAIPIKEFNGPIQAEVTYPTLPTGVTVTLQGAVENIDANYVAIGPPVSTVSGGAVVPGQSTYQVQGKYNYIRYFVSGLSGTGKIIAKVL